MPIEQLLALYNCVTPTINTFTSTSASGGGKRKSKTSRNAGLDKTLMPPPDTPKTSTETISTEKAKDEQSEGAAVAEMETETESKLNTDTELNEENDVKEEIQSEPCQSADGEDKIETNDLSKVVDGEKPSKSENKEALTECTTSDKEKENQLKTELAENLNANGPDYPDTEDQVTKGKRNLGHYFKII